MHLRKKQDSSTITKCEKQQVILLLSCYAKNRLSGCTAVPRYRVTHWLYSGYSCMATACGSVCNSPWQQPIIPMLHNEWLTIYIRIHRIQTRSLFSMGYHGRYCRLVWKWACHPNFPRFQIPCIAVFPAILCLSRLTVARRRGWRASLSNQVGLALCSRDNRTLLTRKWLNY